MAMINITGGGNKESNRSIQSIASAQNTLAAAIATLAEANKTLSDKVESAPKNTTVSNNTFTTGAPQESTAIGLYSKPYEDTEDDMEEEEDTEDDLLLEDEIAEYIKDVGKDPKQLYGMVHVEREGEHVIAAYQHHTFDFLVGKGDTITEAVDRMKVVCNMYDPFFEDIEKAIKGDTE